MNKTYFRSIRDCIKVSPGMSAVMLLLFALGYVGAVLPLITARLIGAAQGYLMGTAPAQAVWQQLAIMCVVYAVSGAMYIFMIPVEKLYFQKASRCFERRLFQKMCAIPQILLEDSKHFEKYKLASEAVRQKGDSLNSMLGLLLVSFNLFDSVVSTAISIVILVSFSPYLLIFAVLSTPLSMVISVFSERARKKLRRGQAQKTRETEYLWGLFCKKESVKEMRVFGASRFVRRKWFATRDEMIKEELGVQSKILLFSNLGDVVKNLFYALNIALAIVLVIRGEIEIGEFTACLGVFATLQTNLVSFMYNLEYFCESVHMAEEYYNFMDLEEKRDGTVGCGGFKGCIEIEGVSFRYPNTEDYALKDICLTIRKGEHIVIVGENGSGKTTLSKLITACYEPVHGRLLFDGVPVERLKKKEYLKNFSVVSQNFTRYNMSLRENIAMSDTDAMWDDERVMAAAKAAGMDETAELIGGIDAQLGREFGGNELSGGQWQKTAIARGLFRNAPIIILDEPTAALDPLVEYEILSDFLKMITDRTSVIISHRIGICTSADRVIVMKDGEIAETGTHTELLKKNGEYARMWNAQAKWVTKRSKGVNAQSPIAE